MKSANDNDAEEPAAEFASPPCLMHQFDLRSGERVVDRDVVRWRKAERERLIGLRLAISANQRKRLSARIIRHLDEALGDIAGLTISGYWAFRGEPDLRPWMEDLGRRGAVCALPVVVQRRAPLVFRTWGRGEALEPGVWDIPVPAGGVHVTPDVVIAPVVGFDPASYRLGYGGGFFDRTLAAMPRRTRFVGVGYARQAIATIYPQDHDVAMDVVVTEKGIVSPADGA